MTQHTLGARARLAQACGILALLALAGPSLAQDKPLRENQVTQSGLIEALAPRPEEGLGAQDAAEGTRGFKLAKPAAARSQSILMTFASDSAELSASTIKMLKVLAQALQSDKLAALHVDIEGHADPRGQEAHNQSLSLARAQGVVDYLVEQQGLERSRFQAVGKGSSELLNKNQPAAAENRRVTVVAKAM